jgi:hypothetical protein
MFVARQFCVYAPLHIHRSVASLVLRGTCRNIACRPVSYPTRRTLSYKCLRIYESIPHFVNILVIHFLVAQRTCKTIDTPAFVQSLK